MRSMPLDNAVVASVVTSETFGTEERHNVTAVGHWSRVSLRRLDVTFGSWHAFVSFLCPDHAAVTFFQSEDDPGVGWRRR